METYMTLHDFVLKLLVDPGARAEFELDPEGVLAEAGLSDITATDVQDVIPLVVDYAPTAGAVDVDDLTSGLGVDPTSAVSQLQGITQHLPIGAGSGTGPDVTFGATAVAGVSVNLGQLDVSPVTLPGLGLAPVGSSGLPSNLSAIGDPANTIDDVAPVVGQVTGPVLGGTGPVGVDGLTGTVGGVADPLYGVVGGVTDPLGGVTDPLGGVVDSTVTGVVGVTDVTVGTVTGVTGALGSSALTGSVTGTHGAEVDVSANPTAPTHTGSTLPGLGHSPTDGHAGAASGDGSNGGITDILF